MTKAERWFAGILALIGGGVAIAAAIVTSFEKEGLTCRDVTEIVTTLTAEDSPNLIPFQQVVVPLTGCTTEIQTKCARLPDGTFCRYGMRYGKGHGGVILSKNGTDPPQRDACNVTDGVITPCVTDGRYDPATYDPKKIDPEDIIVSLKERFPEKSVELEEEIRQ